MQSAYLIHLVAQIVILATVWTSGTELWTVILCSVGAIWISFILAHSHLKEFPQPWKIFLKKDFQYVLLPTLIFACVTWLFPSTQTAPADFWFRLALNGRLYRSTPVYRLTNLEAKPEVQRAFELMREADVCELKVGLRSSMKDSYPTRLRTCHTVPGLRHPVILGEGNEVIDSSFGGAPFLIFKFRGQLVLTGKGKHGDHTAEQTLESIKNMASRMRPLIDKESASEQEFQRRELQRRQEEEQRRDKAAKSFE